MQIAEGGTEREREIEEDTKRKETARNRARE